MKKRLLLSLAMLISLAISIKAQDASYVVQKISNPSSGEREVDGLIPGGDRENSYTWRLAMRGDEIYIATTRNIASALVNMYAPQFAAAGIDHETFWAFINVLTNNDIPRNDANEGARIISYNRKTGDFKVIYTADTGDYFRMAVTFGDDVYFGSYSAVPTNPQYILKLDKDGNFTKVFETIGSVSLRANCVYDGHLFFAGADDREIVAAGAPSDPTKMAVLRKSNDDDTQWDRVADYKDFRAIPFDPIQGSWAGAPIWELASHNGYIYATTPCYRGFNIFRGHPAANGETPNEYGWYWEEVVGVNNGINNPGLSEVTGGEPGTMRSLIGSVYEFKGELYAYNFDHTFGGFASVVSGAFQQMAGADTKPSEYLYYLYNSLQNPQKVWKLNDDTGKFEELENFTKLTEGTTNEYVWRLGEYDNQLYIATMDANILISYLTQLTNGNLMTMSREEMEQKAADIRKLIELLQGSAGNPALDNIREIMEQFLTLLEGFLNNNPLSDEFIASLPHYVDLSDELSNYIEDYLQNEAPAEANAVASMLVAGEELDNNDPSVKLVMTAAAIADAPENYLQSLGNKTQSRLATEDFAVVQKDAADDLNGLIAAALAMLGRLAQDSSGAIDLEGVQMYMTINSMVTENQGGFDLVRTSDGENFEVITQTGFDDKYNYGCPAFLETEEGLYIGTTNPFYGGQLYLLTNSNANGINDIKAANPATKADDAWYSITGMRLKGEPTQPGIYIHNGKKVVVSYEGKIAGK